MEPEGGGYNEHVSRRRASGILLHPTSLPGQFGIGDLGPEAYRFADFLAGAGQRIWQVLPLGPTGYGDSPYQLFSAFAGNPLLISLERLVEEGWLEAGDLAPAPPFPEDAVDYGAVMRFKLPLLRRAAESFVARGNHLEYDAFCRENAWWLDDYAAFMALKQANGGAVWTRWTASAAPAAEIAALKFAQFAFYRQWAALRRYLRSLGIRIMGDLPIYIAHDSADVWAHRDLFQLDEGGDPVVVSGVPPDYFSATGQLWGNPIYRWDRMAESGYRWWIERLRAAFALVDLVRLDHFRGFEAYWEVPAGETTAMHGKWVKGPGPALFDALREALGELPIVAENLGVITPEVEAIRTRFGFPGDGCPAIRLRQRPAGAGFQAAQLPAGPGRLHRDAR